MSQADLEEICDELEEHCEELHDRIIWLLTKYDLWSEDGGFEFPDGEIYFKPKSEGSG